MNNGRYWIILVLAAVIVFTSASLSGLEAQMQPPKNLSPDVRTWNVFIAKGE